MLLFEEYTQDYLLALMLEEGKKFDVSVQEGSLVYNACSLMAVMLEDAYDKAEELYINSFADTCDREHLIRKARDRGLEPKEAVKTVVEFKSDSAQLLGLTVENEAGDFTVTKLEEQNTTDGTYTYEAQAVQGGIMELNDLSLYPIDAPDDFDYAQIAKVIKYGQPEEETEDFRERYFESFTLPGQFGNERYYKDLVFSVSGVKACNVYVNPNDIKTIYIQVLGSNAQYSSELAGNVLAQIADKVCLGQKFAAVAPTVYEDGRNVISSISLEVVIAKDAIQNDIKQLIKQALINYVKEINLKYFGEEGGIYFKGYEFSRKCESIDGVADVHVGGVTLTGKEPKNVVNVPKDTVLILPEALDSALSFTFTQEV